MKKISKRTRITKFTSFSYFTEKLRKPYWSVSDLIFIFFLFPFTNVKWNMLTQDFQKFYGSIKEATEAPETIFLKRGGACRPVASSLSNPTSKMYQKGLDSNFYLHPYLDKFTPLLCWFFFRNVTEPYGLRNDTSFLSVMSQNFTDYATIPFLLTFGMLWNLTNCAMMLSFYFCHVTELHELTNDGCQVPRSGQTKVACHQTMVPGRN